MSALKDILEKALSKSNSCSEARWLATFIEDMLSDDDDDLPALVVSSMEMFILWANDFKRAAEQSE